MNIANIFGLHLGCKVKFSTGEIAILSGVDSDHIHINNTLRHYQIKDCKLLLKPLSSISEGDKAQFQKKFGHQEKIITFEIYEEKTVLVCFEFTDFDGDPMDRWDDMSLSEIIWLASKGYDVGIVPDEYKEIYHGK